MPNYVLVTEIAGETMVLTEWCMNGGTTTPVEHVRARTVAPVLFADRWRAKRFLRKRDAWRSWRVIPYDRL